MDTESNDYAILPKTKTELMNRIAREWTALQRASAGLSEVQMSVPDAGGWSIKDNLAHLSAWENFMRQHYLHHLPPHQVMEIDEETFKQADENVLNAILFRRNTDRSVADVLAELQQTHEQVLSDLDQMSFADLMKPRSADDPEARPLIG
ncbi:MAG TPA: ClbS/DfsB family four-helix bundle protein, partial [Anaerolineae bacterium]